MANKLSFREFLDEIADLTDSNAHGEAILLIADYFGYSKYIEILEHILAVQDLEGHLPKGLGDYRYEVMKEILNLIKRNEGDEIYDAVTDCL